MQTKPKNKGENQQMAGDIKDTGVRKICVSMAHLSEKAEKTAAQFQEESAVKNVCMFILKTFYLTPYKAEADFYEQFEERLKKAEIYFFEIRIRKRSCHMA